VVARIFRLRLALLLSVFRGGVRNVVRAIAIGALAIVGAFAVAWMPQWLADTAEQRTLIDIIVISMVLAAAAFVPIFAKLATLEPRQFAHFPTSQLSVSLGLFISTVLTWPALLLITWMVMLFLLRPEWEVVPGAVTISALLTLLLAIAFVRVSSGAAKLLVSKRAATLLRWLSLLLLLAALPVVVFVLTEAVRSPNSSMTRDAAAVLGMTPFGASAAGLSAAVQQGTEAATVPWGIAFASLVVLMLLWHLIVHRSFTTVQRPEPAGVTRDGLELFERFPAHPREVIAARALTYWRRDPRYRVALFAIPFAPVVMLIALWVAGVDTQLLALLPVPVMLLLLAWSTHNDVALDSTAIWMHVASGTRGVHDRAGRLAPVMLIGLPVVVIGSSVSVTFGGDWRVLPAVIGLNLGVLLTAAGISSVFSALMPYPATRPGDTPFGQPAVQGSGAGLAQTLSMLVTLLFVIPIVACSIYAIVEPSLTTNTVALLFGAAWGGIVLVSGLFIGGRTFDRGAPELLAVTQTFD
jgi:ABC-2 type transport system permease protein